MQEFNLSHTACYGYLLFKILVNSSLLLLPQGFELKRTVHLVCIQNAMIGFPVATCIN